MTSRNLSSNFGSLLKETLRRNIWAVALSLLGFLFALPLPGAMFIQNMKSKNYADWEILERQKQLVENIETFLSMNNSLVKMVIIALAVVCGVAFFRYLHSRQQTDFYHSLPVKRATLFAVNFAAGAAAVIVPYLIAMLISGVIVMLSGCGEAFWTVGTAVGIAVNLVFFLAIYASAVLCTVLCGNTIVSLLLFCWSMFSVTGALATIMGYRDMFYETSYGVYGMLPLIMTRISPIIQYICMGTGGAQNGYQIMQEYGSSTSITAILFAYLLAAIALTALACWLFMRRKSERSGSAIAFAGLKLPLRLWCTAVMAAAGGILFAAMVNEGWLIAGCLIGGLLTHCVMEMIYAFDFKAALHHWKSLLVFGAVFAVLLGAAKADVFGFDRYVPRLDQIESVAVQVWSGTHLEQHPRYRSWSGNNPASMDNFADLTDPQNIEAVRTLGEIGAEQAQQEWQDDKNWRPFNVFYQLKSGGRVARRYNIPESAARYAEVEPLQQQIRFSEEYIQKRNAAFAFERTENDQLHIFIPGDEYDQAAAIVRDQQQMDAILEALREESLTVDYDMASATMPVLSLTIASIEDTNNRRNGTYTTYNSSPRTIPAQDRPDYQTTKESEAVFIYPSFTKTLALMKEYAGVQPRSIQLENIDSAELTMYYSDGGENMDAIAQAAYEKEGAREERRTVTNRADIAALAEHAIDSRFADDLGSDNVLEPYVMDQQGFAVAFKLRSGNSYNVYYFSGQAPEEIFEKYYRD